MEVVRRCPDDKVRMHAIFAWPTPLAMQHSRYCGLPLTPHLRPVAVTTRSPTPTAETMEWAMTIYSTDEAHGAKAFTWTVIAATALLLLEVTWPQAYPAPPATTPWA